MTEYFVITRATDANEVEMWNNIETEDASFLYFIEEDSEWITWKVIGDSLVPFSYEPWVKSMRVVPDV
jgi:hypothetical protein